MESNKQQQESDRRLKERLQELQQIEDLRQQRLQRRRVHAEPVSVSGVIKSKDPHVNNTEIITHVMKHSEVKRLDPAIVFSIIELESGFNRKARNPKSGASGLMQIMMTYSANRFRHQKDVFMVSENIRVGTDILRMWMDKTGSLELALFRYSGGEVGYPQKVIRNSNKYRMALNEDNQRLKSQQGNPL